MQDTLRLTIVDGFAGGGRYSFRGEELPGSPIILLRTIAEAEQKLNVARPKGFEIKTNFVFIDDNALHTDFLRAEIEKSEFANLIGQNISILTSSFSNCVDKLIADAARHHQKGRALFVLDQYGWSNVVFSDIQKILTSLPKAEVFLNFAVDSLIDYLSEKHAGSRSHKNIDLSPSFVTELVKEKTRDRAWRFIIQNKLYEHIQNATGAEFYSPFFIRSPESGRSYWLLHLSRHREARNTIGKIHWEENNVSVHHGRAGFKSLGFSPDMTPDQMPLDFDFDESARTLSLETLADQIPVFVRDAVSTGTNTSLETVFGNQCNDTPVTAPIIESALIALRDANELTVWTKDGKLKPRARNIDWSDEVRLPKQRKFFGPFGL